MKLFIGPAGNCASTTEESLQKIKDNHLHAQEVEFVRQVYLNNEHAKKIGALAQELNIHLSVHAPYYINLASKEKTKIEASKKRIIQSAERAHHLKASPVVFHIGYYQNRNKEEIENQVIKTLKDLKQKTSHLKTKLAPELTGKKSQIGSLDFLIRIKKELNFDFCLDLAHFEARHNNQLPLKNIIKKIKPLNLNYLHTHLSGINYTEKGERSHAPTPLKKIKDSLDLLSKLKIPQITIINESPQPFLDALKTLQAFKKGKRKLYKENTYS